MGEAHITDEALQGVAFVGRSLGPFFRCDPKRNQDAVGPSYEAIMQLDARAAAAEWPFAEEPEAYRALCLMQEGLEDDLDEDALTWEYRRLFVGPGHKAAAPWGSVYTDKDGVMFGASWVALRAWMRSNGLTVESQAPNEPEDHIGLMLELMAYLAQHRPDVLPEYLRLHLLTWAGHYLDLVEREARHPFFEGLAQLTHASLDGIQQELGLHVDYPRFYR